MLFMAKTITIVKIAEKRKRAADSLLLAGCLSFALDTNQTVLLKSQSHDAVDITTLA